jgi:hypothetical protein
MLGWEIVLIREKSQVYYLHVAENYHLLVRKVYTNKFPCLNAGMTGF